MLGEDEEADTKPAHQSADDLSDGFVLDKEDRRLLSYKVSGGLPLLVAWSLNSQGQLLVSCLTGASRVGSVNLRGHSVTLCLGGGSGTAPGGRLAARRRGHAGPPLCAVNVGHFGLGRLALLWRELNHN